MNPPPDLNAAGLRAWNQAIAALDEQTVSEERFEEVAIHFAEAIDLADRLQRQWVKLKRPTLTEGGSTGKADVPHPLIRMIAEAKRDAARFGAALGLDPQSRKKLGAVRGRPQERVPDRKGDEPPKVVPLRAVS